jgi:ABC-type antimicrobial peptide transport system permease subunit
MAYAAAERKLEMGIRVAIGATSTDIVRLFTLDALRLVAAGAASGVVLARVGARLVASLLFGVTAGDPATYLSAVGFLTVVGLMAGAAPALRATRVDLMKAVRNE